MSEARFTSFLVKVASRCNLDCDYCYVYHHADQSWRAMPPLLSERDREAFVARLKSYTAECGLERCLVAFHGGEPLLAGFDSLASFAHSIRTALHPHTRVDVSLQTNGLLLTAEALRAFEAEEIGVSLSLDGPQAANDLHRTSRKGRSSFKKALAALELLRQHPKIFTGVIAVIDPTISPRALLEFFSAQHAPNVDFLLPDAHHLNPPRGRAEDPDRYTKWLVEAFDVWFEEYSALPVRTFEALLDSVAGLPSGTDAFGLGDVSLLTIETDGTYHDLDVLKITGQGRTRIQGSVRDTPIREIANSASIATHRLLLSKEGLASACRKCPEVGVCGGGSLPHRFGPNGFSNPTVYCEEMLGLIRHIRRKLKAALQAQSHQPSVATPPFDIAGYERAEDSSTIVSGLYATAQETQAARFREVLHNLGRQGLLSETCQEAISTVPPAQIAVIACRPGAVAWTRAMAGKLEGRPIYAVDGTPLNPSTDYLDYLLRLAPARNDRLDIAENDPWLRLPFGSSIYFETDEVTAKALPVVESALRIIEGWRPALATELRSVCRAIQFIRDPSATPEKIVSFSDNAVPGALYVSVVQNADLIDPYDLADSLVHEYRHQKLYLFEREYPVVERTDIKVVSPWREDLRPPSGLMHAIFVFIELRRFWLHVVDRGPSELRQRALDQLADTDRNLDSALSTLRECPLTAPGRILAEVLDDARRVH
ncbi:cyclophane-forming radical SAM/SPASM peptide maturase YhhB [Bradyrhizobium sp. SZCCHNRI1073]|uniref:cyclophane-forming radical SAM/SPASM peptide maturase YhhB n=1 Tax=Bradyrhizobium sp. SZCCHNRI1073 TaxID=3057280 RepID=UPI002916CEE2|nr:cyclophane-forming radical SAM/SPASM peptide maturase YhhB [Bradyrhizobium sp. SZCCHNRI1073]